MPDLITHSLFIYPAKKFFPKGILFLLIGSILPDLLGRSLGVFISDSSMIGWYQTVIHTPLALLLFIYSFSFFFPEKGRRKIFLFLALGVASHLFLDLFQKTLGLGYLWFFPFSFKSFQIPLIWPDESIYLIPGLLLINILAHYFSHNRIHAKK